MDAFAIQIGTLLAAGHTTLEVAEALEIDPALVRAVAGTANADDRADMLGVLKSIAMDRKVRPGDRIKAAIYVHAETHGRNDKNLNAMLSITPAIDLAARLADTRLRALPRRTIDLAEVERDPTFTVIEQ